MENIYVWKDDEDTLTEKYFVNKLLKNFEVLLQRFTYSAGANHEWE